MDTCVSGVEKKMTGTEAIPGYERGGWVVGRGKTVYLVLYRYMSCTGGVFSQIQRTR